MATKPGRNAEDGFTLMETLVAIMILITGIVAVSNLFAVAMSSTGIANQATVATAQAVEQLEALKATPFDDAALNQGGDLDDDVTGYSRVSDIPGAGRISVRWQITQVDNQLKAITVRSQALDAVGSRRTRAEFRTMRSCTARSRGCPVP